MITGQGQIAAFGGHLELIHMLLDLIVNALVTVQHKFRYVSRIDYLITDCFNTLNSINQPVKLSGIELSHYLIDGLVFLIKIFNQIGLIEFLPGLEHSDSILVMLLITQWTEMQF